MVRTTGILVTAVVVAAMTGCQTAYPWGSTRAQPQDSVNNLTCGETLYGLLAWYQVDGNDYPSEWTLLCEMDWELEGTLIGGADSSCYNCRCAYEVQATLLADTCDWFSDDDVSFDIRLGFTPTAKGDPDYSVDATDWPWEVYIDLWPSYGDSGPAPMSDYEFTYMARVDEDALTGTYDAGEYYLSSYWYWWAPNDQDMQVSSGWIGLSD
jgi:hypothetical protein